MRSGSSRQTQLAHLRSKGYVVVPEFIPHDGIETLNASARQQIAARRAPLELEAALRYPGAPSSTTDAGGDTIRRLLDAYHRDPEFARWAVTPRLHEWMGDYFKDDVMMSCAHHNCLMTKHPQFGSMTGWHRDSRYWSFAREDLVSAWFALGEESIDNGGLWFVPYSHTMDLDTQRFDSAKFFRADDPVNRSLIETAESPRLGAGDAVFFHSNTLHSAGKNLSVAVKLSLVFTYHGADNAPLEGTRSRSTPEIALSAP